jgi:hypothetical protein
MVSLTRLAVRYYQDFQYLAGFFINRMLLQPFSGAPPVRERLIYWVISLTIAD